MKRILFSLLMALFLVSTAYALDFTLDTPKQIINPAVGWNLYSYTVTPNEIEVHLNWYDSNSMIVRQQTILLHGSDYTKIMNSKITAKHVGKKKQKLFRQAIKHTIKTKLKDIGVETQ